MVAAGVVGGMVGSLLTVGSLQLAGTFDTTPAPEIDSRPVDVLTGFTTAAPTERGGSDITNAVDIAKQAEPALQRLEVDTPLGRQTGTAIALDTDGHYLTSAELLGSASALWITGSDGKRHKADLLSSDSWTNLAVLKADDPGRPPTWGDSADLSAGSDVVVVGAAPEQAASPSVARGVIGTTKASYTQDNGTALQDLLRIDANMLPGARGGLLVDASTGAVVGVISTIGRDESGDFRIGYATPIEVALDIAERIVTTGRPTEAWLGIVGESLTDDTAAALNLPGGVLVQTVIANSPAQLAGLAPGDVVVEMNGQPILGMTPLVMKIREIGPGRRASITFLRDGQQQAPALTILEDPSGSEWPAGVR
ncbi:MAG: S1C family serine protease [Acidimicrobiia bacterium]|nr:S1C family serine protease [Acidimicrobiia bacterium]